MDDDGIWSFRCTLTAHTIESSRHARTEHKQKHWHSLWWLTRQFSRFSRKVETASCVILLLQRTSRLYVERSCCGACNSWNFCYTRIKWTEQKKSPILEGKNPWNTWCFGYCNLFKVRTWKVKAFYIVVLCLYLIAYRSFTFLWNMNETNVVMSIDIFLTFRHYLLLRLPDKIGIVLKYC